MRDGPQPISGPRPRSGRPGGPRRAIPLEHVRGDARPHREPASAGSSPAGRVRAAVVHHRSGVQSRNRRRAGAKVPRAECVGQDVRPRVHARAQHPSSPGHLERRRPAVRAARVASPVSRRLASRRPRGAGEEHAGTAGALGTQHFRRSPDSCCPRGRGGRAAAHPGGARSAGVLAAEGSQRGHRHRERAPGELPRRDARSDRDASRRGTVACVEGSPRRRLSPPV